MRIWQSRLCGGSGQSRTAVVWKSSNTAICLQANLTSVCSTPGSWWRAVNIRPRWPLAKKTCWLMARGWTWAPEWISLWRSRRGRDGLLSSCWARCSGLAVKVWESGRMDFGLPTHWFYEYEKNTINFCRFFGNVFTGMLWWKFVSKFLAKK